MAVGARYEKIIEQGAIQNADGDMVIHMHPEGGSLEFCDEQKDGEPCIWCARGVPRSTAIRRVVEDGLVTITDVETGEQVVAPYRLED
jgi:hypothetical protein